MSVCCECLLSCSGLCDELITRPESPTDCGASRNLVKKQTNCGVQEVSCKQHPK